MLGELTAQRGCKRRLLEEEFETPKVFEEFAEGEEFPFVVELFEVAVEFKEVVELSDCVNH